MYMQLYNNNNKINNKFTVGYLFSRAVNFVNLSKNLFCRFNFSKFMPSAILYCNNLSFVKKNLQIFKKSQNPQNLQPSKKAPYGNNIIFKLIQV